MEESDRQLSFVAAAKKKFTVALISSVVQFGAKLVVAIRQSLGEGLNFSGARRVVLRVDDDAKALNVVSASALVQFVDEAAEAGVGADVEQLHELIVLGVRFRRAVWDGLGQLLDNGNAGSGEAWRYDGDQRVADRSVLRAFAGAGCGCVRVDDGFVLLIGAGCCVRPA
ncbi:hypothetical protein ON010_g16187 [Phytophthora cinnamomi]|nr:hypothetical protein ON010_g16187 [Phytophthora cinnamomi]